MHVHSVSSPFLSKLNLLGKLGKNFFMQCEVTTTVVNRDTLSEKGKIDSIKKTGLKQDLITFFYTKLFLDLSFVQTAPLSSGDRLKYLLVTQANKYWNR
ncbi:hypothetical protein G9A89_020017 [Geosiphon pyriformis]|nr:hypothetical protein G9A89_020017 [Geosiphon pyriformis]